MSTEPKPHVLYDWFETASRGVCDSAKARVRAEICTHVSERVNSLIANGCPNEFAVALAVKELGSPRKARANYRHIYLTRHDERRLSAVQEPPRLTSLCLVLIGFAALLTSFAVVFEPGDPFAVQISLQVLVSGMAAFGVIRYVFSERLSLILWSQAACLLTLGATFMLMALVIDFETIEMRSLMVMFSAFAFVRFVTFAFDTKRLLGKLKNADGGAAI